MYYAGCQISFQGLRRCFCPLLQTGADVQKVGEVKAAGRVSKLGEHLRAFAAMLRPVIDHMPQTMPPHALTHTFRDHIADNRSELDDRIMKFVDAEVKAYRAEKRGENRDQAE